MRARAAALLLGCALAALLPAGCGGESGEAGTDGFTAYGMADCVVEEAGISYPVYVKVRADGTGRILSVEDDGTQVPDGKDAKYRKAQALFADLAGRTAETLSEADAVSGATCSSQAILSAVEQALAEADRAGETE